MTFLYLNTDSPDRQTGGITIKDACGEMQGREVQPLLGGASDESLRNVAIVNMIFAVGFSVTAYIVDYGSRYNTRLFLADRCVFNNVTKEEHAFNLGPDVKYSSNSLTPEGVVRGVLAIAGFFLLFGLFSSLPFLEKRIRLIAGRCFAQGEQEKQSGQHSDAAELLTSLEKANRSVPDECIPFLLNHLSEESLKKLSFSQAASIWKADPPALLQLLEKEKLPLEQRAHWEFLILLEKADEKGVVDLLRFPSVGSLYQSESLLFDLTIALLAKASLLDSREVGRAMVRLLDRVFLSSIKGWKPDREELWDCLLQRGSLQEAMEMLLPPELTVEVQLEEQAFLFSKEVFLENGYNNRQQKRCLKAPYPKEIGEMLKALLEKGYVKSPGIIEGLQLIELAQELGLARVKQPLEMLLVDILVSKSCLPADHQEVFLYRKKGRLVSFYNELDRRLAEAFEDNSALDVENRDLLLEQCRFVSAHGLLQCKEKLFAILQKMLGDACDKEAFAVEDGKLETFLQCVDALDAYRYESFSFLKEKLGNVIEARSQLIKDFWLKAEELQNTSLEDVLIEIFLKNKDDCISVWSHLPKKLQEVSSKKELLSVVVLDD